VHQQVADLGVLEPALARPRQNIPNPAHNGNPQPQRAPRHGLACGVRDQRHNTVRLIRMPGPLLRVTISWPTGGDIQPGAVPCGAALACGRRLTQAAGAHLGCPAAAPRSTWGAARRGDEAGAAPPAPTGGKDFLASIDQSQVWHVFLRLQPLTWRGPQVRPSRLEISTSNPSHASEPGSTGKPATRPRNGATQTCTLDDARLVARNFVLWRRSVCQLTIMQGS